ncbi:DUF805 domain-containing protein [Caenimonas koreensis DSM 17982]|uniref:DUF805 domain-containing protein n=1 Tax=Caenimonas koreensis DSM 17982 TaxID=1121255 RepID=A0A844B6S9_9BURK|nr:DUF805 domain-containing protein [Caenimonas koreensis]MRD48872.1 DUF805 domain-containing protein [Caenimonas koreensis DSM 17982]
MDEYISAVKTCLNKYADFTGRAARPEFWWFVLFWVVVLAITGMVSRYLYGIAALALFIPMLAAGARRLHDTGKSGWFQLLSFIPFFGTLFLIYLMAQPGNTAANQYGEPPSGTPAAAMDIAPGQQ